MKISSIQSKNHGFTLVELLVVIAIIGILAIAATSINFGGQNGAEKRDRFAEGVINLITKTKTNAMIGRAVSSGGNMINPASTRLSISTGSLVVNYLNSAGSVIGTGDILKTPFYGETGYKIAGFSFSGANGTSAGTATNFLIDFDGTDIVFTGGISASGVILNINTGYTTFLKNIRFDRRTGSLEIE